MHSLTGLFIGAGFSYEAGMPLVWELTSELRGWLTPEKFRTLNEGWKCQGGGVGQEVVEDVARVLSRPDMHYEAVLGYLEAQYRRPNAYHVQHQYHYVYSWLVETIYHLLHLRSVNNAEMIADRISLLDGITHFVRQNAPLWIFSVNHDLIVEALAARHAIRLNCGFPDGIVHLPRRDTRGNKIGELAAEVIHEDHINAGSRSFFAVGVTGINLLKIHGSLDVFTFRDGKDLLRFLPAQSSPAAIFETLRAANTELIYVNPAHSDHRVKPTNEIAYADASGEMQFLRRTILSGAFKFDKHRDQVLPKRVLDHFRYNLLIVSDLICMGYGFSDPHINNVIREWLEWSAERTLKVVDPAITAVPGPFMHLTPQIELHSVKAVDYLDRVAGISRTRLEVAKRRFAEWTRKQPPDRGPAQFAAFQNQHYRLLIHRIAVRVATHGLKERNCSPEEYAARMIAEMGGTMEDFFEAFLDSVDPAKQRPKHDQIAEAAYLRWIKRGRTDGLDVEDWLVAEAMLQSGTASSE